MVVELSVEEQHVLRVYEGLVSVLGEVHEAEPVVCEGRSLIPEIAGVVGPPVGDRLCNGLE